MPTVTVKKVGDELMMAVPPSFLSELALVPGATLEAQLEGSALIFAHSPRRKNPYRYTAAELLAQGDYERANAEPRQREWVDAPAVGGELI